MTREEAIYRIKNMAWLYGSAEREQNIEAIDMAIEALQADAVSLTGTMKYLTKPHNYCDVVRCKDCKWYKHVGCAIRIVDDTDEPKDNDYCSFGERKGGEDK